MKFRTKKHWVWTVRALWRFIVSSVEAKTYQVYLNSAQNHCQSWKNITLSLVNSIKTKYWQKSKPSEIPRNPVSPDESLLIPRIPHRFTGRDGIVREHSFLLTWILFDVETKKIRIAHSCWKHKISTQSKPSRNTIKKPPIMNLFILIQRQPHFIQNHPNAAKHYDCCSRRRDCLSFRSQASPQLGSSRLFWVKWNVASSALTRHTQGMGHVIEPSGLHWLGTLLYTCTHSLQTPICSNYSSTS